MGAWLAFVGAEPVRAALAAFSLQLSTDHGQMSAAFTQLCPSEWPLPGSSPNRPRRQPIRSRSSRQARLRAATARWRCGRPRFDEDGLLREGEGETWFRIDLRRPVRWLDNHGAGSSEDRGRGLGLVGWKDAPG